MKKFASLVGAGALLLGMAGSVFAIPWPMFGSDNYADVENEAVAIANTGGNSQSNVADVKFGGGVTVNGAGGDRTVYTGDADAYAGALVVANTHIGCGLCSSSHDDDVALVGNWSYAEANTGANAQDDYAKVRFGGGVTVDGGTGTRYVSTGGASSTARAWTVVNTHWGM